MCQRVIAPALFGRCMRGLTITKILHLRRCWEWWVILFLVVWPVLTVEIRLGWDEVFFLSSLFSLMPLKFAPSLSNNNCILQFVTLSILSHSFYYYLFCIWWFFKFSFFFNFISRHFIQFDFCIQFGSPAFDCFFNVFYTYLD
jgi:hypothetical protein